MTAGRRPTTPEPTLAALEADEILEGYLGEAVVRAFVATKRRELEAFRNTVTAWEREQYAETL